jgi:hypothetical protein
VPTTGLMTKVHARFKQSFDVNLNITHFVLLLPRPSPLPYSAGENDRLCH